MVFMLWIILLSEKGTKKNNDSSTITKRFENRDSILLEDRFMLMYICSLSFSSDLAKAVYAHVSVERRSRESKKSRPSP